MQRAVVWRPPGRIRRLAIILTVLLTAIIGLPSLAIADPPSTTTESNGSINCELDEAFLGMFFVDGEVDGEAFRFLEVIFDDFAGGQFIFGFTEEFEFDGTSLNAEVEMAAEMGGPPEPVGVATISATLTPLGEPEVSEDRFREGNVWVHQRVSFQPAEVAGFAALESFFDFDLSTCFGDVSQTESTTTNPTAFTGRFSGQFLDCALEGPDGAFGFLIADAGDHDTFAEVFIVPADGPELGGFTEDFTLDDSEASGVIELFDFALGEPAGEAVVSGSLTVADTFVADIVAQNVRVKVVITAYDVAGAVEVNGEMYEMVDCFSEGFTERVRDSGPNGPKPAGKTPVNDLPSGAISLEDRGTTNAQTRAAADLAEAECVISFTDEGEEFEFSVPIGKTLWYSFEGTGDPVTVDTGGSNFDTVLGIYDADLNQVVCVDDVGDESGVTLQAAATVDTTSGTTYWVQVGGFGFGTDDFPAEYGRARINLN